MVKKWIGLMLPIVLVSVMGCASTSDSESGNETVEKSKKSCQKVKTTGSRLSRCH
jgi:hypothetical protein